MISKSPTATPPSQHLENPMGATLLSVISIILMMIAWKHLAGPALWIAMSLALTLSVFLHYRAFRAIYRMAQAIT